MMDHVRDAFHARKEVAFNGIRYLWEEKMLARRAWETMCIDLYVRGMKRWKGKPYLILNGTFGPTSKKRSASF